LVPRTNFLLDQNFCDRPCARIKGSYFIHMHDTEKEAVKVQSTKLSFMIAQNDCAFFPCNLLFLQQSAFRPCPWQYSPYICVLSISVLFEYCIFRGFSWKLSSASRDSCKVPITASAPCSSCEVPPTVADNAKSVVTEYVMFKKLTVIGFAWLIGNQNFSYPFLIFCLHVV